MCLINKSSGEKNPDEMLENHINKNKSDLEIKDTPIDDRSTEEIKKDDSDLYNVSNFNV